MNQKEINARIAKEFIEDRLCLDPNERLIQMLVECIEKIEKIASQ